MINRNVAVQQHFNAHAELPYELRIEDFRMAMQDVYDFFFRRKHVATKQRTDAAR